MSRNQEIKKSKKQKYFYICFLVFLFSCFFVPVAWAQQPAAYPDIKINIGGFSGDEFRTQGKGWQSAACPDKSSNNCLSLNWIGQYISVIYRYGVGLAAVLAAIMIMVGGFLWLASAGNPSQITKGKEFVISALTGLILALFSFIILQTINPRLVALEPVSVTVPPEPVEKSERKEAGNIIPLDTDANEAVAQLIQDCQQRTPHLNCDGMIQISNYSEYEGTYQYDLAGNQDLFLFLSTVGTPSPMSESFLSRQGISYQYTYNGAAYSLYGDQPGQRYWRVIKLGNLSGFN